MLDRLEFMPLRLPVGDEQVGLDLRSMSSVITGGRPLCLPLWSATRGRRHLWYDDVAVGTARNGRT